MVKKTTAKKSTAKTKVAASTDATSSQQNNKATVDIQKIYIKDVSYEAPNTPAMFRGQWQPHVNLELNTSNSSLDNDVHEVVLDVTVTVTLEEKIAFVIQVKHAGIFAIAGLEGDILEHTLGSFCPNIIFPYLREVVSDLVIKGGFPQLNLTPINFEAVYQQFKQQQDDKQTK